jgi:hypothetical protein
VGASLDQRGEGGAAGVLVLVDPMLCVEVPDKPGEAVKIVGFGEGELGHRRVGLSITVV